MRMYADLGDLKWRDGGNQCYDIEVHVSDMDGMLFFGIMFFVSPVWNISQSY